MLVKKKRRRRRRRGGGGGEEREGSFVYPLFVPTKFAKNVAASALASFREGRYR